MGLLDIHELASSDATEFSADGRFDCLWRLYIALKVALSLEEHRDISKRPVVELLKATGTVADRRLLPLMRGLCRALICGQAPTGMKVSAGGAGLEFVTERGRIDVGGVLEDADHILQKVGRRIWILFDKVDEFAADRAQ